MLFFLDFYNENFKINFEEFIISNPKKEYYIKVSYKILQISLINL